MDLGMTSPVFQGYVMDQHIGQKAGRSRRAEVAQETLKMLEDQPGGEVLLKRFDKWDSCTLDPFDCLEGVSRPHPYTEILVEVSDVLDSASRLVTGSGPLPLVLNMANPVVAGGGFLNGARAQEEELCRRTNLYPALQRAQYPLPEFGVLWSSPVDVIRHGSDCDYLSSRTTFQVAVASAAAYQWPPVDWKLEKLHEPVRSKMQRKIHALLAVAAMLGHSMLVLSAWGCGAFGNPGRDVAELFREALHDPRLRGVFRLISFAILDSEPGGVGANVEAFRSVFGVRSSILGLSAHVPASWKLSDAKEELESRKEAHRCDSSVLAEAARLRQHLTGSEAERAGHRSASARSKKLRAIVPRRSAQVVPSTPLALRAPRRFC